MKLPARLVQAETARQVARLQALGIDSVRVGIELEFEAPERSNKDFWQAQKAGFLDALAERISVASPEKRAALQDKHDALQNFNAHEVMMYDLIEDDPATRHIFEPLFGTGRDGDGYYDGPNTLELKIAHSPAQKVPGLIGKAERAVHAKMTAYGFPATTLTPHVSFSFWKDGGNVLDPSHPDFAALAPALAAGMTRAAHDAFPLLIDGNSRNMKLTGAFSLAADRETWVRSAAGRIEVRLYRRDADSGGVAASIIPLMLTGAAAGLDATSLPEGYIAPARLDDSPMVRHLPGVMKVTTHALNGCLIYANGRLTIPEEYIRKESDVIAFEIGMTKAPDQMAQFLRGLVPRADYEDGLVDFFRQIRIERQDGQDRIVWPATSTGRHEIVTPDYNMDILPRDLQDRMRNGGLWEREEVDMFCDVGDTRPHLSRTYSINLRRLEREIVFAGRVAKPIVPQGYDIDAQGPFANRAEARWRRMMNSPLFAQGLSPDFKRALQSASEKSMAAGVAVARPASSAKYQTHAPAA